MREFAPFMPNGPEVHVTSTILMKSIGEIQWALRWARRPPISIRLQRLHSFLDSSVQSVVGNKISSRVSLGFFEPVNGSNKFVVAAPYSHAVV